jgi:hypothetical protein
MIKQFLSNTDVKRRVHRVCDIGKGRVSDEYYENPIHYSDRIPSYIMFLEIIRIQKYG